MWIRKKRANISPFSRTIDNIMCSMLSECIGCCRQTERSPKDGKCLFDWEPLFVRPPCAFHRFIPFCLPFNPFFSQSRLFNFFHRVISNKKTIVKFYAIQNTYNFLISHRWWNLSVISHFRSVILRLSTLSIVIHGMWACLCTLHILSFDFSSIWFCYRCWCCCCCECVDSWKRFKSLFPRKSVDAECNGSMSMRYSVPSCTAQPFQSKDIPFNKKAIYCNWIKC